MRKTVSGFLFIFIAEIYLAVVCMVPSASAEELTVANAVLASRLSELGVKVGSTLPTAQNVTDIRGISIAGAAAKTITDADCALLSSLPKLTKLSISGAILSSTCLSQLAKVAGLRDLSLSNSVLDDPGLQSLEGFTNLESLSLSGVSGVTGSGISGISQLAKLAQLSLESKSFGDTAIAALGAPSSLRVLVLSGSSITDEGMKTVAALPNLVELTMRGTSVTDLGISNLSTGAKKLESLTMSHSKLVTPAALLSLAKLPTLKELDLWTCKVGGGFQGLANSPSLENLVLSETGATDEDLSHLSRLKTLRRLVLFGNASISDKGVSSLSVLPSLTELNLSKTPVTDTGVASLAAVSTLEKLSLPDTLVGDASLKALSGLKLKSIDLRATKVTDVGLGILSNISTLGSVNLLQTTVSEAAVAQAKKMLPRASISR